MNGQKALLNGNFVPLEKRKKPTKDLPFVLVDSAARPSSRDLIVIGLRARHFNSCCDKSATANMRNGLKSDKVVTTYRQIPGNAALVAKAVAFKPAYGARDAMLR